MLTTPKDQEISQDKLDWQILKIYENGSMDIIGTQSSGSICLKGSLGYNNGVYLLNDICKTLYSKPSQGIEARSVSLEDFEDEDLLKEGAKWKEERDKYVYNGVQYGHTKTYTGSNSYYPDLYARENGSGIGVKIESTDTEEEIKAKLKQDGIGASNKYYTSKAEETYSPKEAPSAENSLTVKQTYYSIPINEANYGEAHVLFPRVGISNYFVATRCVKCNGSVDYVEFGLFCVDHADFCGSECYLYRSYNSDNNNSTGNEKRYGFRPVVHLKSSVQLELTEAGKTNSATYPHKIIKY